MKRIISILLYIIFLFPYFISATQISTGIITISRYLSFLAFVIIFIIIIKEKKQLSLPELLIILISVWTLTISLYNSTMNSKIFYLIYSWFATSFVTYNSLDNKKVDFLCVFCILLNIFVLINIPYLLNSIGIDSYKRIFIFGGKNQMEMFFIPAIFANYALSYIKYNKLKVMYLCFILLDMATIITCGASTGIVAVIIFILFYIFRNKIKVDIKWYIIILIFALILIFNTKYIMRIDFLYNFIVNILHKDLTFTRRTGIWEYVYPLIYKNIFGYGYGNNIIAMRFYGLSECHNMFLELLLIGGIPLLILFCLLVYKLLENNPNKITNTLLIMCFMFFVIGLTESIQFHYQFWIILIAYYKISNSCYESKKEGERINDQK